MNPRIIATLIAKDIRLFARSRVFAILTPLAFLIYFPIYFLMPSSVDESLKIGLYAPTAPAAFAHVEEEGLEIEMVASEEALKEAVLEGRYVAGVKFPAGILERLASGPKPNVALYVAAGTPAEITDAIRVLIKEFIFLETGQPLTITVSAETLGPDMLGQQIPPRDRLRPLLAIFVLLVEMMALATLIGEEVGRRTIRALLVTPMTIRELFAAKGILGVSMAFGQAALFMAIVGGLSKQPLIVLAALLLGAILVTGIGFLMGSAAKDMLSVMPWLIVVFVPLVIPALGILLPGILTTWVKIIPSYYLVDATYRAASFGSGLGEVWQSLLILLVFDVVFVWIGIVTLKRRFI
ncbi:MAG: ABC transporter permease [Chloroflexota bacterium]